MDRGRRICCIWLPRFGLTIAGHQLSLQSAVRSPQSPSAHSALSTQHSALYRPGTRWQELLECSPDLEAAGVRPGLPLKEAQARFPDAAYLPCDDATLDAIARAFAAVVDALDAFSPVVEPAPREALGEGRAVAYVDVAGLGPLYGPEPHLAARLAAAASAALVSILNDSLEPAAVARGQGSQPATGPRAGTVPRYGDAPPTPGGLEPDTHHSSLITHHSLARAGVAASKFTAWVAASLAGRFAGEERVMIVPPGEEATFLAPLPLETIPLPLRDRQALHRLGVHTLGQFAKLPANAVQHRYGAAGRHAHRLAQGVDDEPLRPRPPQPAARVEIAFDWEETELDRLTFALKMLADQLAARLAALDETAGSEAGRQGSDDEETAQEPWPEEEAVPLESLADRPVFGWEAENLTPSPFPPREGERWAAALPHSDSPSFPLPEGKAGEGAERRGPDPGRGLGPSLHRPPSPRGRGGQGVRS